MPVVQALGSLGIGCVYVPGERIEDVERISPVSGIRVAFVDMKLGIEGTAKEVVGKTVRVLSSVLSRENSPLILVAWTDHPEFVDEFTSAVKRELPFIAPILIHRMQKPKRIDGAISLPKVTSALRRILGAHWPLGIVWALEQLAHEATSNTTQAISNLATSKPDLAADASDTVRANAWLAALESLLRTLILAGAGSNLSRRESQIELLEAFNAMHFERLQSIPFSVVLSGVAKLCQRDAPRLSVEHKAALNTMLLLSPVDSSDRVVRPGNLYLANPSLKAKCPVTRCRLTAANLAARMPNMRLTKDPDWKKADDQYQSAKKKNQLGEAKKFNIIAAKRRQAILRVCVPAVLELTPACDYANRKVGTARFVAGLLVPTAHTKVFDWHEPFIRRVEPLILPGKPGIWQLILNVRALYTITNADKKIDSSAAVRFRTSIQTDILAWFGAHAARPGYLSIH